MSTTGIEDSPVKKTPKNQIYVGDLDPKVGKDALAAALEGLFGNRAGVQICSATREGCSSYAFVTFDNAADAQSALDQNGKEIEGKPCRVMRSDGNPAMRKSNVFVTGFDEEVSDKEIRGALEVFGPTISCKFNRNERPYAYVLFEHTKDAKAAIERSESVEGIKCKETIKLLVEPYVEKKDRFKKVYFTNFSQEVTKKQVEKVFGTFGAITSSYFQPGVGKRPSGSGYVEFNRYWSALNALRTLNGMYMSVGRENPKNERAEERKSSGGIENRRRAKVVEKMKGSAFEATLPRHPRQGPKRSAKKVGTRAPKGKTKIKVLPEAIVRHNE